jgi:phosphatidate cytidylyltransferase
VAIKRVLTAAICLPLLVWLVRLQSPRWFFLLVALAVVLAVLELFNLAERQGIHPHRLTGVCGSVLVASSFLAGGPDLGLVLAVFAVAAPLASLLGRQSFAEALPSIATTMFGLLFVGLLLGYQVGLRSTEGSGPALVFFLLWVVWLSDTAAYYVGTLLGKRLLSPRLSPHKTVEGTLAGMVAAVLAAASGKIWLLDRIPWPHALALGVVLGAFALAGDLCESLLKRGSQVKDSGDWLPGHGGMLDRTDSLLFTAPILYHYWKWFHD